MSNDLPTETLAIRLLSHLPKQMADWTEEIVEKHVKVEKIPLPALQQGQVLVRMERAPINPVDLLIMSNQYARAVCDIPLPITIGYEGDGTVIAQGGGVESLVGKRVGVFGGGWAEYCVVSGASCLPLPDDVSWEEGSSAFVNPLTAIGMIKIALDRGLTSIIHTAAASALGKMLIKYGKVWSIHACSHHIASPKGVDVICVVRREEQVQECKAAGATHVFNSNDKDFDSHLKKVAHEANATLCYDAVAGDLTGRVLAAMPKGSEIQVYGGLSLQPVGGIDFADLIFERKRVSGYWLTAHMEDPTFPGYAFPQVPGLLKGELATKVHKTFALEDIHKAVVYYFSHMTHGKSLINLSPSRH